MLYVYVLIGLDWAEPMMKFPLHVTCSSSSDPTLSHIWFRDDDAFKAFSENFSR